MLTAKDARKISKEIKKMRRHETIESAKKFCNKIINERIEKAVNLGLNNVLVTHSTEISGLEIQRYLESLGYTVNNENNGSYSLVISW